VIGHLDEANRLRNNLSSLLRGTKFNLYFGWLLGILGLLPKSMSASLIPPGVMDLINFRKVSYVVLLFWSTIGDESSV
jgi:hypothetical protein